MLYLIRLKSFDRFNYKVGYTSDVQKRFEQYVSHALIPELIATRDGEKYEENIVHRYLHTFTGGYWNFEKDEWYVCAPYDESIISYFKEDYEIMKKRIWEFRDMVLSSTNSYDQTIWKELYNGLTISKTIQINNGELIFNKFWELDNSMFSTLFRPRKISNGSALGNQIITELDKVINNIESQSIFEYRLKFYCEAREKYLSDVESTKKLLKIYLGTDLENLYSHFGYNTCKASGFKEIELTRKIQDELKSSPLKEEIYKTFKTGNIYKLVDIKTELRSIYSRLGINRTPKASELLNHFNVKDRVVVDKATKKRFASYQLISIK